MFAQPSMGPGFLRDLCITVSQYVDWPFRRVGQLERKSIAGWVLLGALAFMLAGAVSSLAQARRAGPGHHAGTWLRKYKDLPPDQQQKALDNDKQFRSLPLARQQILRERLRRFNTLPAWQRQRILDRMETWEHLTPGQKTQARQLFSQLRGLPPARRRMMADAIRELSQVPPQQRQSLIESDRYRGQFTAQERDLLREAARLPLAPNDPNQSGPPEEE